MSLRLKLKHSWLYGTIRIRYCKLFRLLIDRGLRSCIIRVLICLYTGHMVRVAWNGMQSKYFSAVNGVKQGGVLSPILYLLYTDGLLVKLSIKLWCWMLHWLFFVGALANYADDLVLLAHTPSLLPFVNCFVFVMSMQMNLVSNLMQRSLNGWLLYLRSDVGYRLSWTFVSFT